MTPTGGGLTGSSPKSHEYTVPFTDVFEKVTVVLSLKYIKSATGAVDKVHTTEIVSVKVLMQPPALIAVS